MSTKLIKKDYLNKIKTLKNHDKSYYDENNPKITDAEYDLLKKEILKIERKFPNIIVKNSPSSTVGFKPSRNFLKANHRVRMLSLSNVFSENDLLNFEKKLINFLDYKNNYNFSYSVEPKIDGISASLTYKNGKLIGGLSRGDGLTGELITENLKTIKDIPKEINFKDFPKDIDVRGEVFINNNDFKRMKDTFANARNAASGSLRQKDPNQTKKIPLKFIAYSYGYVEKNNFKTQSGFIKSLKKWGFKTNKLNSVISGIQNLVNHHKKFETLRFELNYDVDGLVYKINDLDLQERLGFVANAPRWATAHKFSAQSSFSEILDIDIQIGRTGALTPVAKIKPVNIAGVVVSNASLHNEDEILRKDIRVNDIVKIERAGDVIPHVIDVDLTKRKKNSKKFVFPDKCPSCGSKIIKEYNKNTKKYDAIKRCSSEGYDCEKMSIEKIKHFISKDALNIDGFGKKVVEKFWDLNFIKFPYDIFRLNYNEIEKLEGWGKLSVSNLKYSIDSSKSVSLDKLIYSLGIRHIGQENAKLIAESILTIENLGKINSNYDFKNLLNIDGIGETQIKSLVNFFSNETNLKIIKELKSCLKIKNITKINNGKLRDKTFLITGKLNGISRAEVKSLIEKNSGKILSSVNSKLNFLVIGDKPTNKKIIKARELNIETISQGELLNILK